MMQCSEDINSFSFERETEATFLPFLRILMAVSLRQLALVGGTGG